MRGSLDSGPADFVHFAGERNCNFAQGHGLCLDKNGVNAKTDSHAFHTAHGVRLLQLVVGKRLDIARIHDDLRLLRKIEQNCEPYSNSQNHPRPRGADSCVKGIGNRFIL